MRRRLKSDDHQLLLIERLDLQPLLRAPRFVDRAATLGDDPFEAVLRRVAQRFDPRLVDYLRDLHAGGRTAQHLLQDRAALLVRRGAEVFSVEPEDVEEKDELAISLLQQLKARRSFFVEGNDLAVEHDLAAFDLRHRLGDAREALREIDLVAAQHRHLAAGDADQRAEAVVFQFVNPRRLVARRLGGERRQHRRKDAAQKLMGCHAVITRSSSKPSSISGACSFFLVVKIATSGTRARPSRSRLRMMQARASRSKKSPTIFAPWQRPRAMSGARSSREGFVLSTTTLRPAASAVSISFRWRSSRARTFGIRSLLTCTYVAA